MLSIAYVSVAAQPMSELEVASILETSRVNNQRNGLTGALLYHRGRFVQILEGPKVDVLARFAIIAADPRHREVQVMREVWIGERQFAEWTMGFRSPEDASVRELDGFEDFFGRRGKERIAHADNEAQQFLEWLGEYWLPPV